MFNNKIFNGSRLKSARIYRGKTISQLAEEIEVSKQAISQFENNKTSPGFETLLKLTSNLEFPQEYFYQWDNDNIEIGNTYFRAQASLTKKEELSYSEKVILFSKLYNFLDEYINFPELKILVYSEKNDLIQNNEDIEILANSLREKWDLGDKPISNLVSVMEKNGFKMTSFNTNSSKVDAFTQLQKVNGKINYYIVLGNDKNSAVRRHFDLAHELGHIVLHDWAEGIVLTKEEYKLIEKQANEFASAFLLPRESFLQDLLYPNNLNFYINLKRKWKVSIGAMIIRAYKLGAISYNQYQYLIKQMSKNGWRKREPLDDELKIPKPALVKKSLNMILENNVLTKKGIVDAMHEYGINISIDEIEFLLGLEKGFLEPENIIKKENIISFKQKNLRA